MVGNQVSNIFCPSVKQSIWLFKYERNKLDAKAKLCTLLGYGSTTKDYRLYDPSNKKIFYSRDVIYNESQNSTVEKESLKEPSDSLVDSQNNANGNACSDLRKSIRIHAPPNRYGDWTFACNAITSDPQTVKDALNSPEAK